MSHEEKTKLDDSFQPTGILGRISFRVAKARVQTKITCIILFLVLLLGLSVILQVRGVLTHALTDRLREQGTSISKDLASRATDLILTNNSPALHKLLRDTLDNNKDLRYAFFLGPRNEVIAHSFGERFPESLIQANPGDRGQPHFEILETEDGLVWDFASPVLDGEAGTARLGVSERHMREEIASSTRWLLLITFLVSVMGIIAALVLTRFITHPLSQIVEATNSVASGDLAVKAPVRPPDEIGELGVAFNRMVADLAFAKEEVRRKEKLRANLLQKVITAQEEERKRIARELHDQASQSLTSLMVGLKVLETASGPEALSIQATKLKEQVVQILDELRGLARELRPTILDDLGLVAALEHFVADYSQRFGIRADFQTVGLDGERLPPPVETELYRIIQEAMVNAARHSKAQSVSVLLERRRCSVIAVIEDDGIGFPVGQFLNEAERERNLGLLGMQERASLLGGEVTIESAEGAGTSVFAEIPLDMRC